MDFIIGRNVLVTARYDTVDALHKFGKALEVKEVLEKENSNVVNNFIFLGLLKELYRGLFDELDYIEDLIEDITRKIFQGRERDMVVAISEVTRNLLDFKKTTDLHHDILDTLFHRGRAVFGDEFSRGVESIMMDYLKINSAVRNNLEMLRELRDTNNSLLSTKRSRMSARTFPRRLRKVKRCPEPWSRQQGLEPQLCELSNSFCRNECHLKSLRLSRSRSQ